MPQLDTAYYLSQVFWFSISFGIILFVFSKILIPSIQNALNARKGKVEGIKAKNYKIIEQSKVLTLESSRVIQKAYEDAKAYKNQVVQDLNHIISSGLRDFERSAIASREESMTKLSKMKEVANAGMETAVVAYAACLIRKISRQTPEAALLSDIYRGIK